MDEKKVHFDFFLRKAYARIPIIILEKLGFIYVLIYLQWS